MSTTPNNPQDEYVFQAEINQLMSLIINSFYSNREIFLRELISNASDAIDKHRYETLASGKTIDNEYSIKLIPDKSTNTLSIVDNGIGMSSEELVTNLGTIARSGTKLFMEKMNESENKESLIGQFGVGFYSAFLVAYKVDVYSKKDEEVSMWSSKADGKFTINKVEDEDLIVDHGCKIVLHLKDDVLEYLEERQIKDLVKKHNGFINYPIELEVEKTITKEVEKETAEEVTTEASDEEGKVEEVEEGKVEDESNEDAKTTTIEEVVKEFEKINTDKPIWTKKTEEITDDEYNTFYKSISNDWEVPLAKKHFSVEGQLEFKGLLYIPKRLPFDMFENSNKKQNNIKLHVKKVFVTDDSEYLCPEWMNFVKGIVDCDDLPLNISREFLQQNRVMKVIQKNIVKKVIEMINELSEEDSCTFYKEFGKCIKLGICNDSGDAERLSKLLRFNSIHKTDELISFEGYVNNMKENQEVIYYLCGDNLDSLKKSHYLEKFKSNNIDVLLMHETIDEYMVQRLREYKLDDKTFKLQSISREGLVLPGEDKFVEDEKFTDFCKAVKEVYGNKVEKVTQTNNAIGKNIPCTIVSSEYGWSANMERIMKAQALRNNDMMGMMGSKKVVELNTQHPLIICLQEEYVATKKISDQNKSVLSLILEVAMVSCGYTLEDPNEFSNKLFKVIEGNTVGDSTLESEESSGVVVEGEDEKEAKPDTDNMEQVD